MPLNSGKEHLRAFQGILETRAKILRSIRRFFDEHGFLEVETPVRIPAPPPEVHIDAIPSGRAFLRTSPELHMKRLLVAGYPRLYQMGPCFRQGEFGPRHNPEFTLLEWYRANAHYADILLDTKALLLFVAKDVLGTTQVPYQGGVLDLSIWERWTVSQAFIEHAGWDPVAHFDADRFDQDLVEKVEPAMPKEVPVVLTDYPLPAAALSRPKEGQPEVAERWELYLGGLELANAYSELESATEQRQRFAQWNQERATLGKETYPEDTAFLDALDEGLPPCGGIALGVDRLVMLLTDSASLDEILPFRARMD